MEMGTKNNPGKYDCYAAAQPDEPRFVLLGRDRHASALVLMWAAWREQQGEDPAKVAEARQCADDMVAYRHKRVRESRNAVKTLFPFGINKDMDEWAFRWGLPHWSCVSPNSNNVWIRIDGEPLVLCGNYVVSEALRHCDAECPMRPKTADPGDIDRG